MTAAEPRAVSRADRAQSRAEPHAEPRSRLVLNSNRRQVESRILVHVRLGIGFLDLPSLTNDGSFLSDRPSLHGNAFWMP